MDDERPSITVTELKDFVRCHRLPVLRLWRRRPIPPTLGMLAGRIAHANLPRLDAKMFGSSSARIWYELPVYCPVLALSGRIDLVVEADDGVIPVDLKVSDPVVDYPTRIQIVAYCLLAAKHFGKPCREGFILFADTGQIQRVSVRAADEFAVRSLLFAAHDALAADALPDIATRSVSTCASCDVRRLCGEGGSKPT